MHEKFEQALAHLEDETEEKDNEISANNAEIQKLGDQVYALEEENDKLRDEFDRVREDDIAERERLEALSAALKDVRQLTISLYATYCNIYSVVETRVCERSTARDDRDVRAVQPRYSRPSGQTRRARAVRRRSRSRAQSRARSTGASRV